MSSKQGEFNSVDLSNHPKPLTVPKAFVYVHDSLPSHGSYYTNLSIHYEKTSVQW